MKEIELTKGKVALVDNEDYDYLIKRGSWLSLYSGKRYYAYRQEKGIWISMHGLVLERKLGRNLFSKMIPDHIDRDSLNNTRNNLREVTISINGFNCEIRPDNISGVTGVFLGNGRWQAQITIEGNRFHLGSFNTFKDAVLARRNAEAELNIV